MRKVSAHRESSIFLYGNQIVSCILFRQDCLLIVDAVDTLGAVKVSVDDWKIDVAYGSSQKGLGSCSGIVPVTYSQRALDKLKSRKTHIMNAIWDMKTLINAWQTYDESKML